jgi:hypothetical protein
MQSRRMFVMFATIAAILFVSADRVQAAPLAVRQLYDPNEPGSVLVFPKFVRGSVGAGVPATEFEISVHCPTALFVAGSCTLPVPGTTIRMAGHWVCPGDASGNCKETDFIVNTTVEGTIWFNTEGVGFANVRVPPAPCAEGFLVMWAVDTSNRPIKFDGLVGDVVLRWNSHAAASYNAIAIQASAALANGALISLAPGGALLFDGLPGHYAAVTGTVMSTVKYDTTTPAADAPVTTSLTLLTLDILSGAPNDTMFTDLDFYDANENVLSESTNFTCWVETPLSAIDTSLTRDFLSRKGFFVSVDATDSSTGEPVTMLGLIDTQECPGTAGCTENVPVTASNNPNIVNHYAYKTDDDSIPIPTCYAPTITGCPVVDGITISAP